MGVETAAFRAALAGAVGAGRGVSVGAGAGASVESSPHAATASMMIAVNARATGLMCVSRPQTTSASRIDASPNQSASRNTYSVPDIILIAAMSI